MYRNDYDIKYAASAFWTEKFGLRVQFFGPIKDPLSVKKGVARAYHKPNSSRNG